MDSRQRLLTAWEFREADRVPIELQISPVAYEFPEAEGIVRFIKEEADNFIGVGGLDFGFMGLPSEYTETVIEDRPGEFKRIRRSHLTAAGEFFAITKHKCDELIPQDFHWERRFIDTLEDMDRLAGASKPVVPFDREAFDSSMSRIGNRGLAVLGLNHPLGTLVRRSNMEEVYGWLITEREIMHRFLESSNEQVAQAVESLGESARDLVFGVCAHEMLIPPWMGPKHFDEFVFPYDKRVNDAIHAGGGRLRAHCHGNCMAYLEEMSRMGIDAIEPLEPPPFGNVDLAQAKAIVGDRMLLSGNVPSQDFLRMTREQVRAEVRRAISQGAKGGGFTLRNTGGHVATNSVKDEEQMRKVLSNIDAFIEAAREYGTYPLSSAI